MMMNPGQGPQPGPGPHHGPVQTAPGPGGPPNQPQPPGAQVRQPPVARPEDAGRLAKSRDLVPVLHSKWNEALKEAGSALSASGADTTPTQHNKFETSVEDFFATLDQIELNLKCAAETTGQSQSISRYMQGNLNYHQHISSAKHQVIFTKSIKDMLRNAAKDIVEHSIVIQQPQQQPQAQHQGPPQQQS